MTIANLAEALEQGAVDSPVDWDPRPDQERFWKFLVNGGKMTVEVAHRVFCIKYGPIWVTNFKRTIVDQESCLPSMHTKHGGKGSDPGRRWRDELQLDCKCWERPSAAESPKG